MAATDTCKCKVHQQNSRKTLNKKIKCYKMENKTFPYMKELDKYNI